MLARTPSRSTASLPSGITAAETFLKWSVSSSSRFFRSATRAASAGSGAAVSWSPCCSLARPAATRGARLGQLSLQGIPSPGRGRGELPLQRADVGLALLDGGIGLGGAFRGGRLGPGRRAFGSRQCGFGARRLEGERQGLPREMHVLIDENDVGGLGGKLGLRGHATVPTDGLIEPVEDGLTAQRRLFGAERQPQQREEHRCRPAHARALEPRSQLYRPSFTGTL